MAEKINNLVLVPVREWCDISALSSGVLKFDDNYYTENLTDNPIQYALEEILAQVNWFYKIRLVTTTSDLSKWHIYKYDGKWVQFDYTTIRYTWNDSENSIISLNLTDTVGSITNLKDAIDDIRSTWGIGAFDWPDWWDTGVVIGEKSINELRRAIGLVKQFTALEAIDNHYPSHGEYENFMAIRETKEYNYVLPYSYYPPYQLLSTDYSIYTDSLGLVNLTWALAEMSFLYCNNIVSSGTFSFDFDTTKSALIFGIIRGDAALSPTFQIGYYPSVNISDPEATFNGYQILEEDIPIYGYDIWHKFTGSEIDFISKDTLINLGMRVDPDYEKPDNNSYNQVAFAFIDFFWSWDNE